MNKYCPLIGITLGGFQVFDKPTYIPLGKFTLLFGPNSSGKSAIQDAIDVVNILESDERLFSEPDGGLSLAEWNQIRQNMRSPFNDLEITGETPLIFIKKNSYLSIDLAIANEVSRNSNTAHPFPLPIEVENRWLNIAYGSEYELHIASEMVVRAVRDELTINLIHPILKMVFTKSNFSEVAKNNEDKVQYKNGILTLKGVSGFNPRGLGFYKNPRDWIKPQWRFQENELKDAKNHLTDAVSEISCLIGHLMKMANNSTDFEWTKVDASRRVPTAAELTFKLGSDISGSSLFSIQTAGDEKYRKLAISISSERAKVVDRETCLRPGYTDFGGEPIDSDYQGVGPSTTLATKVNHALSHHLFVQNLYRVGYHCIAYLNETDTLNAFNGHAISAADFHLLVQLHLRDAQNRELLFENVGSGIGYVLPVLCAVYDDDESGKIVHLEWDLPLDKRYEHCFDVVDWGLSNPRFRVCFIQQPELHLHPALQAGLGDVFIEASGGRSQLIVETHSEHLLLRLLRRVRETHQQVNLAEELMLKPADLCVLYFDPQGDGTTKVCRLRVTRDGDFLDRWPNGFFEERCKELFGE